MSADNAVLAFNEHLFSKLPFNPEKDFTYIGAIGKFPLALVVHPDFPAKDFKEFLAYVQGQSRQGQLRLARQRLAAPPGDGDVQEPHRHLHHAHSVSRRGAGHGRT